MNQFSCGQTKNERQKAKRVRNVLYLLSYTLMWQKIGQRDGTRTRNPIVPNEVTLFYGTFKFFKINRQKTKRNLPSRHNH